MGPRLASLALLLLALCRHASYGMEIKIDSLDTKSSSSSNSVSIIPKEQAEKITTSFAKPTQESKDLTPEKIAELLKKLGNTMIALALSKTKAKVPEFIKNSLLNGMLCEAKDENNIEVIKTNVYGGAFNDDTNTKEKAAFGATSDDDKIDCDHPANPMNKEETCLCNEKLPGFWCMLKKFQRTHEGQEKKCPADALKALKEAGTKTLATYYDVAAFKKNDGFEQLINGDAKSIDTLTKNLDDEATNFFCDAMNADVIKAVKDLYAADASYWLGEGIMYGLLFGPTSTDLDGACNKSEFTSNEYGKCVCGKDTGFTFCIYKVLAEFFKEVGFLDCEKKKFVEAKKPTAVPKIGSGSGGSSGGGGTNAAATSTLLLAPTAAATLLLQLRH